MAKPSKAEVWSGAQEAGVLAEAKRALKIERDGIDRLIARLDKSFEEVVRMVWEIEGKGKVVVTGVGKSGHVAHKIAATLASTGTPSLFLHPAEAMHGDLGMVASSDIVLALSNSGSTVEILALLGPLRRIGVKIIAMTGNPDSELARRAELNLDVSVAEEACPLGLAPTASTTAAMAMGDALAVCLLKLRNFRPEDYAVFHPGGNLGKKLVTTVGDLMVGGMGLPKVSDSAAVADTIAEIQRAGFGVTSVVDTQGVMLGAFSMGDFTRLNLKDPSAAFMKRPVSEFMTRSPKTISPSALAAQALNLMETHHIRALFAVDEQRRPVGIIGIYEVLQAIDY